MRVYSETYRSLLCVNGERNCFVLDHPSECFIQRVIMKQSGPGTLLGATLDIYNSARICTDGSESSGGADPAGEYTAEPETYRVLPSMTAVAGESATYIEANGINYRNVDGTYVTPVQQITVQITPGVDGTDANSTWDLVIAGWTDIG